MNSIASRGPGLRISVEVAVIVGSILLAFGIEAAWTEWLERAEEQILLSDLVEELVANRAQLELVTARHTLRIEQLGLIIDEAGLQRRGLGADSLDVLAEAAFLNPVFYPEVGVMERATNGNSLSVVDDPDLRAKIAGFWDSWEFYFSNQWIITGQVAFSSSVLYDTGTLVWRRLPNRPELGPNVMWSDTLSPAEANALKYYSTAQYVSEVLVEQGDRLHVALDELVVVLELAVR
jgi:hypothetical protein